jgi:hypothetical protein
MSCFRPLSIGQMKPTLSNQLRSLISRHYAHD